jgi:hypothetical protein
LVLEIIRDILDPIYILACHVEIIGMRCAKKKKKIQCIIRSNFLSTLRFLETPSFLDVSARSTVPLFGYRISFTSDTLFMSAALYIAPSPSLNFLILFVRRDCWTVIATGDGVESCSTIRNLKLFPVK